MMMSISNGHQMHRTVDDELVKASIDKSFAGRRCRRRCKVHAAAFAVQLLSVCGFVVIVVVFCLQPDVCHGWDIADAVRVVVVMMVIVSAKIAVTHERFEGIVDELVDR